MEPLSAAANTIQFHSQMLITGCFISVIRIQNHRDSSFIRQRICIVHHLPHNSVQSCNRHPIQIDMLDIQIFISKEMKRHRAPRGRLHRAGQCGKRRHSCHHRYEMRGREQENSRIAADQPSLRYPSYQKN